MGDNIHVLSEVMGFLVSGGEGGGSENYKETDLSLPIKTPSPLLSSIEHTAKYVVVDTTHNHPLQRDILQLLLLHLLLLLLMLNPFTITQHKTGNIITLIARHTRRRRRRLWNRYI